MLEKNTRNTISVDGAITHEIGPEKRARMFYGFPVGSFSTLPKSPLLDMRQSTLRAFRWMNDALNPVRR
jgi:hypothetical protein